MLKPEDCKPGVEVIAIKNINYNPNKPQLKIGNIYTIEMLVNIAFVDSRLLDMYSLTLLEMVAYAESGYRFSYVLECFKLRKREELINLFQFNSISEELLKENEVLEIT